ncbi:hypothetical protein ADL03_26865 [Nocardia sp. NRRL S-836]|nr:hypothetical protein ADL03_26865 [Nocardia sp. NRRL S-836]
MLMDMDAQISKGNYEAREAAKEAAAEWLDTFGTDSAEYQLLIDCLAALSELDKCSARNAISARYGDVDANAVLIDGIFDFMTQVAECPELEYIMPDDLTTGETANADHDPMPLNTPDAEVTPAQGYAPTLNNHGPALLMLSEPQNKDQAANNTDTRKNRTRPYGLTQAERTPATARWVTPSDLRDWTPRAAIEKPEKETIPAKVRTPQELADREPNWLCVVSYFAYRLGIDDDPRMTEGDTGEYFGYSFADENDDTTAAKLMALPCVACNLPRARTQTVTASADNGLCPECASAQRAGFPHIRGSRHAKVTKRCEWIASRYPSTLHAKLTAFASQSGRIDRDIILKWAETHFANEIRQHEAAQLAAADTRRAADTAKALRLADEFPNAIVPIFRVWWNTEPGSRAVIVRALTALCDAGRIRSTNGKATLHPATVATTADAATVADERARLVERFPAMADHILAAWMDEVVDTQATTGTFAALIGQIVAFARTYPRAANTVITAWDRPTAHLVERAAVRRARQQLIKSGEFVMVDGELTANSDRWTHNESGHLTLTPAEQLSAHYATAA